MCQRSFVQRTGSCFSDVEAPLSVTPVPYTKCVEPTFYRHGDVVVAEVDRLLKEADEEGEQLANIIRHEAGKTEVSPWLEMTRWPRYLNGLPFDEVAQLIQSPRDLEVSLQLLCDSLDRVVMAGKASVDEDKIKGVRPDPDQRLHQTWRSD